jgi:hypothetical protein
MNLAALLCLLWRVCFRAALAAGRAFTSSWRIVAACKSDRASLVGKPIHAGSKKTGVKAQPLGEKYFT